MKTAVLVIVVGLVILLALPHFLDGQIRKKQNRKAARSLCQIFGYLFIGYGLWLVVDNLIN